MNSKLLRRLSARKTVVSKPFRHNSSMFYASYPHASCTYRLVVVSSLSTYPAINRQSFYSKTKWELTGNALQPKCVPISSCRAPTKFTAQCVQLSSSKSADVQRSAKECEIRWLGDRHPQFNHAQWSQTEITRARELVAGIPEGKVDWTAIAVHLGVSVSLIWSGKSTQLLSFRQVALPSIACDMPSFVKPIRGMKKPTNGS